LETTYEGTKLVKSAKLQMLISRFEEIKMLEEESKDLEKMKIEELVESLQTYELFLPQLKS
jgi:hypothetical protein